MESELGGTSLRMLGSLMAVLGLILLLFYFAKRLRMRTISRSSRFPEMRLLGTLNLAPKRGLALVEFSDQWLIVGVGVESVTLISKMDKPAGAEAQPAQQSAKGKSFQEFFSAAGLLNAVKSQIHGPVSRRGQGGPAPVEILGSSEER